VEFRDVVVRRRMVRRYDPDRSVPAEVRDRILEHALHAPSAGFTQGWAFVVLEEPADRARFWEVTSEDERSSWTESLATAPLLVIVLSSRAAYLDRYAEPDKGWTDRDESRWPVPYWHVDAGMAGLLMLLTAVDEGLGACFFGVPAGRVVAVRAEFGIPDQYDPVGVVSVGYRAPDTPSPSLKRGRRELAEVVHHGRW
jgi:nitroreductase